MRELLPTMTRRRFLFTTLTAGAGLLCRAPLMAGAPRRRENTFALLSDIHISGDRTTEKHGVNMADNLRAAIRQVLAAKDQPSHLFVAGDLANRIGEPYDYPAIQALLEPIRESGITPHFILGNHDDREHFLSAYYPTPPALPVPGKFTQILRVGEANWFLLDSQQRPNHTPGRLGQEQRDWLARELDAAADRPAIVMLHHDFPSPKPGEQTSGLEDADEFLSILRPRKQVKACIFGHTHSYSVQTDPSGIHLINLPAVAYPFSKAPIGWVMAHLRKNGIRLELRTLDPNRGENGTITKLQWRTAVDTPKAASPQPVATHA